MSLTQFFVIMGLNNKDFVHTGEYEQLLIDYLVSLTPDRILQSLCQGLQYEPGVSKAKMLSRPATGRFMSFLVGLSQAMEISPDCLVRSTFFTYAI